MKRKIQQRQAAEHLSPSRENDHLAAKRGQPLEGQTGQSPLSSVSKLAKEMTEEGDDGAGLRRQARTKFKSQCKAPGSHYS